MLISYEPNFDVLTITLNAGAVASQQVQGTATVGLNAVGAPLSISIPNASTTLWEHGGQVNVMLPQPTATFVETTRVVETLPPAT